MLEGGTQITQLMMSEAFRWFAAGAVLSILRSVLRALSTR